MTVLSLFIFVLYTLSIQTYCSIKIFYLNIFYLYNLSFARNVLLSSDLLNCSNMWKLRNVCNDTCPWTRMRTKATRRTFPMFLSIWWRLHSRRRCIKKNLVLRLGMLSELASRLFDDIYPRWMFNIPPGRLSQRFSPRNHSHWGLWRRSVAEPSGSHRGEIRTMKWDDINYSVLIIQDVHI